MEYHDIYYRFPKNFPLPFVLDGATGTNLMAAGMRPGEATEKFVLDNPGALRSLQSDYAQRGSDACLAPTFGCTSPQLERHGTHDGVQLVNARLAGVSVDAERRTRFVGGDISPTGLLLEPYGDTPFEDAVRIFSEQAAALDLAGVDFFFIETQLSAAEARAALLGVRAVSDKPVFVSLTLEGARTMSGDDPLASLITLADAGACAFGFNCSTGPAEMLEALKPLAPYAAALGVPLIAKPNAGKPRKVDGADVFDFGEAEFGEYARRFLESGVAVLGGCCGTTPAHIAAVRAAVDDTPLRIPDDLPDVTKLASTTRTFAVVPEDIEYIPVTDDLSDAADDAKDGCGVLALELAEGDAAVVLEQSAYLDVPLAARGDIGELADLHRGWNGRIFVNAGR